MHPLQGRKGAEVGVVREEEEGGGRVSLEVVVDPRRRDAVRVKKLALGEVALAFGAGALGNEVVKGLAQIGVGRITVVDFDRIVKANLNRCVFFCPMDAANGLYKARVIATRARSIKRKIYSPSTKNRWTARQ